MNIERLANQTIHSTIRIFYGKENHIEYNSSEQRFSKIR